MTIRSVRSAQQDQVLTLLILVTVKVTLRVTVTVSPGVESLLRFMTKSECKWSVSPVPEGGGGWAGQGGGARAVEGSETLVGNGTGAARTGTPSPGAVSLTYYLSKAPRFPTAHCFLESSQHLPVSPSGTVNM